MAGDWKQVEILKRQFKSEDLLATKPLSYSIVGNQLTLGVTEICDGYIFLHGSLTDKGATGDYGTLGLEGFTRLGSFAAVMARGLRTAVLSFEHRRAKRPDLTRELSGEPGAIQGARGAPFMQRPIARWRDGVCGYERSRWLRLSTRRVRSMRLQQ